MSKKLRKFLFISFFFVFLGVSYLLTQYARGLKFDFEKLKWIKTGGIFIELNTGGTTISIDKQKPKKISLFSRSFIKRNLLPKKYSLEISKNGYYPINKEIEVKPGLVTFLSHVYLAKQEELQDFVDEFLKKIDDDKKNGSKLNENQVILDNFVYFFDPRDGLLYKKEINKNISIKIQLSEEPISLKNYKLKILDENKIYLISDSKLYFLNRGKWDFILSGPIENILLSPDKKKLAIIGPYEISVLWITDDDSSPYFRGGHKELIVRLTQQIKEIFWFKTSWHLIFITRDQKRHFIEIDPSGGRNDITF